MKGQKVLVTGATGLMGYPIALALARENEVHALARFNDQAARDDLEAAGVRTIRHDIGRDSFDDVPDDFDYVFHCAALLRPASERDQAYTFAVNVQATGRLMVHCRHVKGFLYSSSGSAYAYQGRRPIREDDVYGVHIGIYSYSKIAAESVVEFAARQWQIPTTMIRICSLYSARGGSPTHRVDLVAAGKEVPLHPDKPNNYNPMYETDYVAKAIRAAELAGVPPLVVNFAGSETMSAEDYVTYAGELLGVPARIRYTDEAYWPLWPDVTRMEALLGPTEVGVREGIRRVVEARYPNRARAG